MINGVTYSDTLLKLSGVSKSLGGAPVLRDVNLEIKDLHRPGYTQGQVIGLLGPSGMGKAQPLDAQVLTPSGFVGMGCLQVGDAVVGSDGLPKRVSAIFPQGVKPVYRVRLSDGSQTECCDEHLWYTQTYLDRRAYDDRGRAGSVKALWQIKSSLRDHNGKRNHSIPLVCPVEFAARPLPFDPYLMGALLGDGGLSNPAQVRFTNVDPDILARVQEVLPEGLQLTPVSSGRSGIDYRLSHTSGRRYGGRGRRSNRLLNALRELGLMGCRSHEKFIPDLYLNNSVSVRMKLLQGLMDTDGYRGTATQMNTSSPRLAEDVKYLVQSLGGTVRTKSKTPQYTYKEQRETGKTHYTITLCVPNELAPFSIKRKSDKIIMRTCYPVRRYIDAVEYVGEKPCQCILVDSADHLYVTDEFILTHNTTLFRLLAGLDEPDSGTILAEKAGIPVRRGMVGVVAQDYHLFAHRTVLSNLTVAGRQAGLSGPAAHSQAQALLERFGIAEHARKYPAQLSGGQRQRVAIAQQLLCSDHFLLMDEPFSGLDMLAARRVSQFILEMAQSDELKTFILVTHDIGAALQVADTILLLGRDRDANGAAVPGARIQASYNLVERDVCWRDDVASTPQFLQLLHEIREVFPTL